MFFTSAEANTLKIQIVPQRHLTWIKNPKLLKASFKKLTIIFFLGKKYSK